MLRRRVTRRLIASRDMDGPAERSSDGHQDATWTHRGGASRGKRPDERKALLQAACEGDEVDAVDISDERQENIDRTSRGPTAQSLTCENSSSSAKNTPTSANFGDVGHVSATSTYFGRSRAISSDFGRFGATSTDPEATPTCNQRRTWPKSQQTGRKRPRSRRNCPHNGAHRQECAKFARSWSESPRSWCKSRKIGQDHKKLPENAQNWSTSPILVDSGKIGRGRGTLLPMNS